MIVDMHYHPGAEVEFGEKYPQAWKTLKEAFRPFEPLYGWKVDKVFNEPFEEKIAMMDRAGVEHTVLIGADTPVLNIPTEYIVWLVDKFPDGLSGFVGINPLKGIKEAVKDVRRAADLGLKGIKLYPCYSYMPTDKRDYPIYEAALEKELLVMFHTGSEMAPGARLEYSRPAQIQDVAVDFPDLKIIGAHLGWPWIGEALIACRMTPNLYFDIAGMVPEIHFRDFSHTIGLGSYKFAESQCPDKIMFATDFPNGNPEKMVPFFQKLPLSEEFKTKFLGENARKLLKL